MGGLGSTVKKRLESLLGRTEALLRPTCDVADGEVTYPSLNRLGAAYRLLPSSEGLTAEDSLSSH